MSSSFIGVSSTSLDTPNLSSTTIRSVSSVSIGPSDVLLSSSTSTFAADLTQRPLTSSEGVIETAPSTATSSSPRAPTTTASDMTTKEITGEAPTATPTDGSLTADDETPTTSIIPVPTSNTSQAALLTSSTSPIPTSASVSTQISSSAVEEIPQLSSSTKVSSSVIPTATPSTQAPSIAPSQSQNQTPTPKSSPSEASAAPETEAIFPTSPPAPQEQPSPIVSSQSISPAAQPTDNSVQEPQVFSAADVAQPSETSISSSSNPIPKASSTASIQGDNGFSAQEVSQPTNVAVSAAGANAASSSPASTPTPAASSVSPVVPVSVAAPSSISASLPASLIIAAPLSTPLSASTRVVSGSIPTGTQSNVIAHATSLVSDSTDGIAVIPTATNTSPSSLSGSMISGDSQPTGQTIADPVSPSTNPSTATIVGGTVGGIAAAAFLVVLLWLLRRKLTSRKSQEPNKGGSSKPMAQKLGIATTLDAVKQNFGGKPGARNVNMNRGNSQFLDAVTVEPMKTPTYVKSQTPPAAVRKAPSKARKLGLSFDHGKLFNPFSDANALMSGKIPPPSSSILANPFTDDNMVLPPPVSAANRRRSRGRSLGGIKSFQAPTVPARPHSVHRESLQSNDSFAQRRDKFRSDPFDLELESRLAPTPPGIAASSRGSSVYSNNQLLEDNRDSYTSRYISGSSLGDWANGHPGAGAGSAAGRRDSPTLS
ncbi:hypothetical protein TGAMA5MH_09001 [Trichoderma gamsii]|uniref:Uncharacterized protein n=1 Tax=Trichoderma gamsii TaxID=398673 RepID=A0A2K0T0V5_9HYPO|nr:hypothetical protein TGAMA5MH_09001 [Trichoderma gamsii]